MRLLNSFQEKNRNFIGLLRSIPFYLYIIKCLLGTIICHTLYELFPAHQLYWSIVSVLLVLAPDPVDSMKLSFARMKANIAGASIGLLYFLCPFPPLLSLCLAVLTTILLCWYFVLGNASRSALAALIIVFINENEAGDWSIALERMGSVIIGCLVALVLTMLFHYAGKILARKKNASL